MTKNTAQQLEIDDQNESQIRPWYTCTERNNNNVAQVNYNNKV